jgi:hypothetical protein
MDGLSQEKRQKKSKILLHIDARYNNNSFCKNKWEKFQSLLHDLQNISYLKSKLFKWRK